jgi:hypothetical protein
METRTTEKDELWDETRRMSGDKERIRLAKSPPVWKGIYELHVGCLIEGSVPSRVHFESKEAFSGFSAGQDIVEESRRSAMLKSKD